jgi:hypothetical protein
MGDKVTLEQLVQDMRSKPPAALRTCSLDEFTLSERMD